MEWQRRSATSIQSGDYIIGQTHHSGVPLYTVHCGHECLGSRWTPDEAKELAESHETGKRNGNEKGNGRKRGQ